MTTTGPVDVYVDTGELGRLRSELELLHHHPMIDGRMLLEAGEREVDDVLDEFRSAWKSASDLLSQQLLGAASLVRDAVEAYEAIENALAAQVRGQKL